ncbi:histidine--tRNA ligase [Alphaproteobacteria bacterium]|jgi:histidyl-tRNA synthetase|nr:histidine--tRNA ligase [Alphaproteobacteria bacterium]
MNKNILPVKGTHDLYGQEIDKFNYVVESFYSIATKFNFKSIQTPILENQELFTRSVGEHTDIVSKEMYSFVDKNESILCLRPEATSGIARFAALNYQTGSLKFSTHGPMFRRERPQKGRYRQFHQINIENIGEKSPFIDFEIIYIASALISKLGLPNDKYNLLINSLGSNEDQINYSSLLRDYLFQFKKKLSETSLLRLDKNPLRILDSKDDSDKEILTNAPKIYENMSKESKEYFSKIKILLTDNGIPFKEDDRLVRGLDYYTHTAFEFQTIEEKRQNAILAGGRYDKLINMISTKDIPGIGWAAGIERLMDLLPEYVSNTNSSKKILLALQKEEYLNNLGVLKQLYNSDYSHEIKVSSNIKKIFSYADKNDFDFLLLIGESEIQSNEIAVKDLNKKIQKTYSLKDFNLENEIR